MFHDSVVGLGTDQVSDGSISNLGVFYDLNED